MSFALETRTVESSYLNGLLSDDTFWPIEPQSLSEIGLGETFVEQLVVKTISSVGTLHGRAISERTGLPFRVLESLLESFQPPGPVGGPVPDR